MYFANYVNVQANKMPKGPLFRATQQGDLKVIAPSYMRFKELLTLFHTRKPMQMAVTGSLYTQSSHNIIVATPSHIL